jgi:hypothetical protein
MGFVCTSDAGGLIGTTAIAFQQFSGAGQIAANGGLQKSGNTISVANAGITLAMHANIATATFIGRNTAAAGVPEELSMATAKTMLGLGTAAYTASTAYLASGGTATAVTNATLTTALTVNTGSVSLIGNVANTSALTLGAGASSVSGANTGDNAVNTNYSGLVSNATHTGDVTGSTGLTIGANKVTLAMQAQMNSGAFLGRNTAAVGNVEEITVASVKNMLGLGTAAYTASTAYAASSHGHNATAISAGAFTGTGFSFTNATNIGTSSANYLSLIGAATAGSPPQIQVLGSDVNADLLLTPKGTGVVKIGSAIVLTDSSTIDGGTF